LQLSYLYLIEDLNCNSLDCHEEEEEEEEEVEKGFDSYNSGICAHGA
jgi:hypothetical protein